MMILKYFIWWIPLSRVPYTNDLFKKIKLDILLICNEEEVSSSIKTM